MAAMQSAQFQWWCYSRQLHGDDEFVQREIALQGLAVPSDPAAVRALVQGARAYVAAVLADAVSRNPPFPEKPKSPVRVCSD